MIDRLVCADGGTLDPTLTHGKNPEEARALERRRLVNGALTDREQAALLGRSSSPAP